METNDNIRCIYVWKYKDSWEVVVHFTCGVILIHIGKTLEYDNAKVEYTKDEILSYNVSGSEVVVKTTDGTITLKEMYKTRSAEGYADPQEDSSK